MTNLPTGIETWPLHAGHDRAGFCCGVEMLDRYLKTQASQDMRRKANAVFVLTSSDLPARIMGYYTLCAAAIQLTDIPEALRKKIARYPAVSATLIGRLAVTAALQGQSLGALLLADAVRRACNAATVVGSSVIIVDALNEGAARFYAAHGFIRLPDSLRLILPTSSAKS